MSARRRSPKVISHSECLAMTDFHGAVRFLLGAIVFLLGAILLLLMFAFPAAADNLVWTLLACLAIFSFVFLSIILVRLGPPAIKGWLLRRQFPLLRSPAIWVRVLTHLLMIASALWVLWLIYAVLETPDPLTAVASGLGPLFAGWVWAVASGLGPPFAGWVMLRFLNDWRDATRRRKGLLG